MAHHLGALAAGTLDRKSAIEALNACTEEVPYDYLFEDYDYLCTDIDAAHGQCETIDADLQEELRRLDGLVNTFKERRPDQVETARELAKKKKMEARQNANAKKAEAVDARDGLTHERDRLSEALDTVCMPWPVAPYSEEVLESVRTDSRQSLEIITEEETANNPDDSEETALEADETEAEESAEEPEAVIFGPHAELAESIPSLIDQLERAESRHIHAYDEIQTAWSTLYDATAKEAGERSGEEDLLIKAVYVLRNRFLEKPNDLRFLKVYEAVDIIELATRLHQFSRKNRPDFDGLEGRILDKAASRIPWVRSKAEADTIAATERMNKDAEGRTGMTWHNLSKQAGRACDAMRAKFFAGGSSNQHLKDYVINIRDRSGTEPDISWIYQFVADEFAFDLLGRRITNSQHSAKQAFLKNCDTIDGWLNDAAEMLDRLPKDFRLRRRPRKRHNFRMRNRDAGYEPVSAATSIRGMIEDIRVRRGGNGDSRTPRHKPMARDPQGALNHQLMLAHRIEALKSELAVYDIPPEGYTEEIRPFA